jgi:hypothetical protein
MWPSDGSSAVRYAPPRAVARKHFEEKLAEKQNVMISDNSVAVSFRKILINLNTQKELKP